MSVRFLTITLLTLMKQEQAFFFFLFTGTLAKFEPGQGSNHNTEQGSLPFLTARLKQSIHNIYKLENPEFKGREGRCTSTPPWRVLARARWRRGAHSI